MRTRTRLILGFLAVHLLLTAVGGVAAWVWIDGSLRAQAETSARAIGKVLADGGFSLTDSVRDKMEALSGYRFRTLDRPEPVGAGTIQVTERARTIEVRYDTEAWRRARADVLLGALVSVLAGSSVFALVAWWLAAQFARPVERLARAARTIGTGDLDQAVPEAGGGEVGALARELEQMRQRLNDLDRQHRRDERLATLGTFTATIAHEVRNPLSAVRLTVQMLARRHGDDPGVQMMMSELERLDLIIDELLGFSGGMTVRPEAVQLRPLAEGLVRLLQRQADHAGVSLAVVGEGCVRADPQRVRQLLMNLVLNGIQAIQAGGRGERVVIELRRDGLVVSDDGPGVDPAVSARLFEPFASAKPGGTGLGLHLAKAIADAHHAQLSHEPANPGARFVLAGLPAA